MPVMRVSDKTWKRLQGWAMPLEDTADSTLARVLDAAERRRAQTGASAPSRPTRPERPAAGSRRGKLSQKAFRQPLLEVLRDMGGRAHVHDLRPVMEERMKPRLLPGDLALLSSGEPRWWNATQFVRHALREEGYLRSDSPRGVWELSEKGAGFVAGPRATFVDHLLAMPDVGEDADFNRLRSDPRETGM